MTTTSSTRERTISNAVRPAIGAVRPSAIVSMRSSRFGAPLSSATRIVGAPRVSTPTTRTPVRRSVSATARPAMRPPPPTATTTRPTFGSSSSISRPIVPCPAITSGSSCGWISVAPRDVRSASSRSPSVTRSLWKTISAPSSCVASTFEAGAPSGMTTTARACAARAADARALAAVPADIVITPRSSACRGVARTAFTIPRGLNEPVTCRFSVLSQTGASTTAPSWVDGSSGVRRRYVAIRSRAAATSSTVTDRVTAVSRTRSTPAASRRSSPHSHPNPLYRVVRVPEPVPPRLIRLTMSIRVVGPREKRHRARITSVPGIRPLAPDIRPRLTEELGPIPRGATIDAELDAQHRSLAGPGVATHDLAATHEDVAVLRRRDDGPRRHRSERTPVDDVAIALEETAERPSQERQTREPFHGRHPVPARNDQPQGRTVLARKRLAVHLVGQQGVLVHRLAQRQRTFGRRTSAEVRDGSGVGAGAEHLDRRTCRAGAFEHRAQRRALPFRGPHRTEAPLLASDARLERGAAVAGAFERDRQRAFRPRPDLFQRQRLRRSTGPGASETPRP